LVEIITNAQMVAMLKSRYGFEIQTISGAIPEQVDPRYLNPDEVIQKLRDLAARFPQQARLHEIGRSVLGRPILAIEISNPEPTLKPAILIDGMHHAREIMTPEVVTDIAETLLTSSRSRSADRRVRLLQDVMSRARIFLVPQLNPDGNQIVWEQNSWWRKNAMQSGKSLVGVDLNRNYDFQWGRCNGSSSQPSSDTYRGPSAASEPETRALMKLAELIRPIGYITYHSYGEMVIVPYGCQNQITGEQAWLDQIGRAVAKVLPRERGQGTYVYGTGWSLLYPTDGTSDDYIFARFGAPSFTIELGTSFQPDYSLRDRTVRAQRAGWMSFFSQLLQNLFTLRVETQSGKPIPLARIQFAQITHKYGERPFQTDSNGVFFKALAPGDYQLQVTLPGRQTQQVQVKMTGEPQTITVRF